MGIIIVECDCYGFKNCIDISINFLSNFPS